MSYLINHQEYSEQELIEKSAEQGRNEELPEWERKLWLFIHEFLTEKNFTFKTSGSTGIPKSLQFRKDQLVSSAQKTIKYFDLKPKETILLCLPVDFVAGKIMVVRALVGKMNLIYIEPASNALKNIDEQIDFAGMVPLQVKKILSENPQRFKFVKKLIIGGAPLSKETGVMLRKVLPDFWITYGMTETLTHIAVRKAGDPFYELLPGNHVKTDEKGRLMVQASHISDQWITTNDMVEMKDKTHFMWLGRYDNLINSGGVKISPEQIERKLYKVIPIPFFIGAMPSEKTGEKIVLFIESADLFEEDEKEELLERIASVLDKYERPKEIFSIPEFMRTDSEKIQRKETMDRWQKVK